MPAMTQDFTKFPITVRIFGVIFGRLMTKLYDNNYVRGWVQSTAQVLFQGVDDVLAKAVFYGTTVLRWDLITIKQTSAKETELKQEP